jgi:hypothetical protein
MNSLTAAIFCWILLCVHDTNAASLSPPFGVDPIAFRKFMHDHSSEFRASSNEQELIYTVSYVPSEFKVINDYKKGFIDINEAEKQLIDTKNQFNLLLQIQFLGETNQDILLYKPDSLSYEERVKYLAFEFRKDVQILDDKGRKIEITGCHFERDFGLSTTATFSFVVKKNKDNKKLIVIINDRIWHKAAHELTLSLPKLPKLKKTTKWKKA